MKKTQRHSKLIIAGCIGWAAMLAHCGKIDTNSSTKNVAETSSEPRGIVGGEDVPQNQQDARRWSTVALTTDVARGGGGGSVIEQGHSFCSGTIIAERVVVTAAHCLEGMDPQTRKKTGQPILPKAENFIVSFDTKVKKDGSTIPAQKVIPHPQWDVEATLSGKPSTAPNDVGIIILSKPIPSTHKPAKIADVNNTLDKGSEVFLAGYGVTMSRNNNDTGTLRQVAIQATALNPEVRRFSVGSLLKGACAGDSGGPAYVKVNGELQLAGATSTGVEIAGLCIGILNNYTDVRHYQSWIVETIKKELN